MICLVMRDMCEYNGGCQLQEIAPDITGCSGHSKQRRQERTCSSDAGEKWFMSGKEPQKLSDFKVGDRVVADGNPHNLRIFKLPGYLAGNQLTVIGFTKEKVICDWDGGKPFRIPPDLLRIRG